MTKFETEKARAVLLMQRLGLTPDTDYENPNAGGRQESGADVVTVIGGRRIGIQVTDIDTGEQQGHAQAAERRLAKDAAAQETTYGTWAQNDASKLIASVVRTISRKARLSFSGFDEFWLLMCAGVPEFGAVGSTFIMTPFLDATALDLASQNILEASKYNRVFLYAVLGVEEKTLYSWERGAQWSKSTVELPLAERGPNFWDYKDAPELLADPDAWGEREAKRVLAELRGTDK
jgi:hypothetical protein